MAHQARHSHPRPEITSHQAGVSGHRDADVRGGHSGALLCEGEWDGIRPIGLPKELGSSALFQPLLR